MNLVLADRSQASARVG